MRLVTLPWSDSYLDCASTNSNSRFIGNQAVSSLVTDIYSLSSSFDLPETMVSLRENH